MTEEAPLTFDILSRNIGDATLQVHLAEERKDDRELVTQAHQTVERITQTYRQFLAASPDSEKMRVERMLGRRVQDLRRLASLLPKAVSVTSESTPDRQVEGAALPEIRRLTGVHWVTDRAGTSGGQLRVGGEIEAWCGKCGRLTTHSIFAIVGKEPKRVICQICDSRHTYRTVPARASKAAATTAEENRPTTTPVSREAEKRAEELRVLAREVEAAENVRPFDPKERYRAGDIISHPEFGLGKVENVLRSSLLVRFPAGGLKSLMLL